MLGNFDLGHLRLISVNDIPLLVSNTANVYVKQDIEEARLLQGGPRSNIYKIGVKHFRGTLSIPLYLDKSGNIADACKEILMCADNPFRQLAITMNFGVMGQERTALSYQGKWYTGLHERTTLDPCAITKLDISVDPKAPITMEVEVIALLDPDNDNDYDLTAATTVDLMSRHCMLADCALTRDDDDVFLDTVEQFNLTFTNGIEELVVIPWTPDNRSAANPSTGEQSSRDYPHYLHLGEEGTNIHSSFTELTRAEDWDNELLTWNHGGYARGDEMKIRFADVLARIRDPLYKVAMFRHAWLSAGETDNLIFADLL